MRHSTWLVAVTTALVASSSHALPRPKTSAAERRALGLLAQALAHERWERPWPLDDVLSDPCRDAWSGIHCNWAGIHVTHMCAGLEAPPVLTGV